MPDYYRYLNKVINTYVVKSARYSIAGEIVFRRQMEFHHLLFDEENSVNIPLFERGSDWNVNYQVLTMSNQSQKLKARTCSKNKIVVSGVRSFFVAASRRSTAVSYFLLTIPSLRNLFWRPWVLLPCWGDTVVRGGEENSGQVLC